MTTALLAALLLPMADAPIDPPVGSSSEYQGLALAVRQASQGDLGRASRLAGLLPRRDPAVFWDDRNVPAVSRAAFQQARDYALAEWSQVIADFHPRVVAKLALATRGLVFTFEPRLARNAGATHFLGMDASGPRLETVIGLRRGEFYTGEVDVHNEVLFAMGTYLGVLPSPTFGGALGRTDVRASVATSPRSNEARIADEALVQATGIRQTLAAKKKLTATAPKLWIEAKALDLGSKLQGEAAETNFTVANNGNGPMLLRVDGDCACLSATGPTRLEPGESGVVRARYDTSLIGGGISHRVLIRTTDPESPFAAVTLNIAVRTLARVIVPGGPTLAPKDGQPVDLYLVHDPSKPLKINGSTAEGVEGELTVTPWSGTLADPALKEGPIARTGYRLRFVPKALRPGLATLAVTAETETGEVFIGNVFLQRGIVATPTAAGFPDLGTTPGRAEIVLSQPGKPFRVLSVRAEGGGISAKTGAEGISADRHKIAILLDPGKVGRAQTRRVIVRTDDPAQPEIVIPVVLPES